jgi:hypothetical protein
MVKKLFILPGGGDPENEKYKRGFDLIKGEAISRGINEIEILKYPGHSSYDEGIGVLNQEIATEIVRASLLKSEELKEPYMVYARSYGCGVIMKLILEVNLKYLHRIVLWGATPIVEIYRLTVLESEIIESSKTEKGCYVSEETYRTCEPFEIQLLKYKGKKSIYIGAGTNDKLCKPVYFNFLSNYILNSNISFTQISGLEHEVTEYDERYIQFVFGNKSK